MVRSSCPTLLLRVVPHRAAVITAAVVFTFATALFATCAAVTAGGVSIVASVVAALLAAMTVSVSSELRADTLELSDTFVRVVLIDRGSPLRRHPSRWFAERQLELRWEEILDIGRSRAALDGPAVVLHLSEEGARRVGAARLALPAIDEIPIVELETELQRRRRHALRKLGVRI